MCTPNYSIVETINGRSSYRVSTVNYLLMSTVITIYTSEAHNTHTHYFLLLILLYIEILLFLQIEIVLNTADLFVFVSHSQVVFEVVITVDWLWDERNVN
jgi:hypothetical protein